MNAEIKINNYKCFKDQPQGFSKIRPINVIIGKNNSGKSSLIELIEQIVHPKESFFEASPNKQPTEILITQQLDDKSIRSIFHESTRSGPIPTNLGNHYEYGKAWVGTNITYSVNGTGKRKLVGYEKQVIHGRDMFASLVNVLPLPFDGKSFKKISSERDISQEVEQYPAKLDHKGSGATNLIQVFLNRSEFDSKVVEKDLLVEINKIFKSGNSFR